LKGSKIREGGQARPQGPRAGEGFSEREQPAPSHQQGGLGNAVSSPSGVRGGAPAAKRFLAFYEHYSI